MTRFIGVAVGTLGSSEASSSATRDCNAGWLNIMDSAVSSFGTGGVESTGTNSGISRSPLGVSTDVLSGGPVSGHTEHGLPIIVSTNWVFVLSWIWEKWDTVNKPYTRISIKENSSLGVSKSCGSAVILAIPPASPVTDPSSFSIGILYTANLTKSNDLNRNQNRGLTSQHQHLTDLCRRMQHRPLPPSIMRESQQTVSIIRRYESKKDYDEEDEELVYWYYEN
ncbi:hypothetical protein GCK72_023314 [Caenorhabditis remanei]|uniref:Uncharacterized protein n=1 Tax=Caenorhabditis remanei TaxID=31234 RepID=A0A6A5FW82_CAERE|nr:hypothetical protein GCK72_023314 [Caenorhabditis remanei]KAF1746856.1 hypothetical protein GCK72_023314 [Caenorhabditis remanei]